jgi:Fe-S cluster assembly protein SufD
LFYLRSRGLGEAAARAILTRGFAAEITREIRFERLRHHVEEEMLDRLFDGARTTEIA